MSKQSFEVLKLKLDLLMKNFHRQYLDRNDALSTVNELFKSKSSASQKRLTWT